MGEEEYCNTGLGLSIGGGGGGGGGGDFSWNRSRDSKPPVQFHILFPPRLKEEEREETSSTEKEYKNISRLNSNDEEDRVIAYEMREDGSSEGGMRKKLRLTKEQSMLLEDSFRDHNTITSARKLYLAQRLNLRPRQVEVWFQNRRARTKLKQTEVDRELLRKRCESLSIENRRMKKELMELRTSSAKPGSPFDVQLSRAATLGIMCPSCKKMATNWYGCGSKDS